MFDRTLFNASIDLSNDLGLGVQDQGSSYGTLACLKLFKTVAAEFAIKACMHLQDSARKTVW